MSLYLRHRGVVVVACCCMVWLTTCGQTAQNAQTRHHASSPVMLPTPTPTPNAASIAAEWMPQKLIMPSLHVSAPIISVGADKNGFMLAPVDAPPHDPIWNEVYWWDGGAEPGQVGNAVIAGHVNRPIPGPAPFTNLAELRLGDIVQIQARNGRVLTFRVLDIETPSAYEYGANNAVLEEIFGPAATPNLNLITCYGSYDGHTFDHRLVVFTRLVGVSPIPHT